MFLVHGHSTLFYPCLAFLRMLYLVSDDEVVTQQRGSLDSLRSFLVVHSQEHAQKTASYQLATDNLA